MGWIRKRPDRPAPWRAGYRGPDGREHSRSFGRKVDAERWLRDELQKQDRGLWVDPSAGAVEFGEYAEGWFRALTLQTEDDCRLPLVARLKNPAHLGRGGVATDLSGFSPNMGGGYGLRRFIGVADGPGETGCLGGALPGSQRWAHRTKSGRDGEGPKDPRAGPTIFDRRSGDRTRQSGQATNA